MVCAKPGMKTEAWIGESEFVRMIFFVKIEGVYSDKYGHYLFVLLSSCVKMEISDNCVEKKHIGYKKCRDGRIVVLEILEKHNEDRRDIVDKQFAKMRCSKARVIRIYNMHDQSIEYDEAYGIYDKTFKYTVGEVVEPVDEFDNYLDEVCGSGIHYFLTEEPAYYWKYKPENGPYESWNSNGQMWMRYTYKNGKPDGLYESWQSNGLMDTRYTYKNGELDGLWESWYENGKMSVRCTYKNGEFDGLYESRYSNGQMRVRCTYKNGKLDGPSESWYLNGQIWKRCTFKNGKFDGPSESWYENGQIWERCTYKNKKKDGLYESWYKTGQMSVQYTYRNE